MSVCLLYISSYNLYAPFSLNMFKSFTYNLKLRQYVAAYMPVCLLYISSYNLYAPFSLNLFKSFTYNLKLRQ